jgi:hypothetical protein
VDIYNSKINMNTSFKVAAVGSAAAIATIGGYYTLHDKCEL